MNPLQPLRNPALGMWLMAAVPWVFASHDVLSKTLILVLPVIFVACARTFYWPSPIATLHPWCWRP